MKIIGRLCSLMVLLWCLSLDALAGQVGKVSRSCFPLGAQESISVDWTFQPHWLWTASSHYRNGVFLHTVNTVGKGINGWEYTWRSYAGHFGTEYFYGYVIGYHYGQEMGWWIVYGNSYATDCNLSNWG